MNLETPQMLWFLVPILISIGIMFKKDADTNKIKKITIFLIRSSVIILLIIAITQPFVLKENITISSDNFKGEKFETVLEEFQ